MLVENYFQFTDNRRIIHSYEDLECMFNYMHMTSSPGESPVKETDHVHKLYEMFLVLEGNVSAYVEENHYEMKRGSLLLLNDREYHYMLMDVESVYSRAVFHFDPSFFSAFGTEERNLFAIFENRRPGSDNFFQFPERDIPMIEGKIKDIDEGDSLRKKVGFLEILGFVQRRIESRRPVGRGSSDFDKRMIRIMEYINSHSNENITLASLECRFNLSGNYLARLFKQYTGKNFKDYLKRKRINKSKKLLLQGRNISDVCYEVGYQDYSHFFRDFKSESNLTPREFIKHFKRK